MNLFGGGSDRFLEIELSVPPSSGVQQTIEAVTEIEGRIAEVSPVYNATIGGTDSAPAVVAHPDFRRPGSLLVSPVTLRRI